MNIFAAYYIKLDSDEEIVREFTVDFWGGERECYQYAMGIAYDKTQNDETLVALEIIAS